MNVLYQELAERIRGELLDLDHVVQRALQVWPQAQSGSDAQGVYLDSVALNLHGLYSGLERLFELIARRVDCMFPTTETWHRDLLRQMAQDLADIRPAVIDQDSVLALDEFRRFRHLVRNVYTFHLVPDKMVELMAALPDVWPRLCAELRAFADFLTSLAQTSQSEREPVDNTGENL